MARLCADAPGRRRRAGRPQPEDQRRDSRGAWTGAAHHPGQPLRRLRGRAVEEGRRRRAQGEEEARGDAEGWRRDREPLHRSGDHGRRARQELPGAGRCDAAGRGLSHGGGAAAGAGGRRGRCGANARQESLRDGSRHPRSVQRIADHDPGGQRVRAQQERRVAGLWRVVEDAGERRRLRARGRQRHAEDAARRPGQLQRLRVRRGRRSGGIHQRPRRREGAGAALQGLSLVDVSGRSD